jgi:hypothetical protein
MARTIQIPINTAVITKIKGGIVSGVVVRHVGDSLLVAIDGQCNSRPATVGDREMLARTSVLQNKRRLCIQTTEDGTYVVEATPFSREIVDEIDEDLRAKCESARDRLLNSDETAHVLADQFMAKGLIAPTGDIPDWTIGDLFPVARSLEMIESYKRKLPDCVEELTEFGLDSD